MSAKRSMCPNERCEHYRKPTGLLGGCDCGEALVPFVSGEEPSDEILGNFASAFSATTPEVPYVPPAEAARVIAAHPELRAAWLERYRERYREVQEAIRG